MANGNASKQNYDVMYKIVLIGDMAVGKTALMQQFAEHSFKSDHLATIGVDFKLKIIQIGNTRVKLQIWDTAGQEKFRCITKADASGIILVYDLTSRISFENAKNWLRDIKNNSTNNNIPMILAGNKCDDALKREVTLEEQEYFAKELDAPFYETSAKECINVNEIFVGLAKIILKGTDVRKTVDITSVNISNLSEKNYENRRNKKCC